MRNISPNLSVIRYTVRKGYFQSSSERSVVHAPAPVPPSRPGLLRDRRGEYLAGQPPDPPHPAGGRLGMVAELLRHLAGAAAAAELPDGAADRLRHRLGARGVRALQPGYAQSRAPRVVHRHPGHDTPPATNRPGTGSA